MMMEGVSTHYLPIRHSAQGTKQEKGVDVWLALEAYELAILKRFDVIVLITSDGDFVPLVRKLNTLGTRVMVLSWDFEYVNDNGARMVTRTSQDLLEEVTYPIPMHQIIEDRVRGQELLVNNLFVQQKADRRIPVRQPMYAGEAEAPGAEDNGEVFESEVITLNKGYGFVRHTPDNLFFYYLDLINTEFSDLIIGDRVRYKVGLNDKGESVARNVERIEE
jgi:cold shock CspA family protein